MHMHTRQSEIFSQQPIGFHDQIVLIVTIHWNACHLDVTGRVTEEVVVHLMHFKCIIEWDGVEHCFQIVIAVGPT